MAHGGHAPSGGGGKWKKVLLFGVVGGLGLWGAYAIHRGYAEVSNTHTDEVIAQLTTANATANAKIAALAEENAGLKTQALQKSSKGGANPPPQNPPPSSTPPPAANAPANNGAQAESEESASASAVSGKAWPFQITVARCRLAGDVAGTLICFGTVENIGDRAEEITFQNPQSPTDNTGNSLWTDDLRFINANYDRVLLPGQSARFRAKFTGASRQATSATITFMVIVGNTGSLAQGVGISGIPVV